MLHTETVTRETLELLKKIMHDSLMDDFALAGGTALALYIGHRESIDLDLFTLKPFNAVVLEKHLIDKYDFHGDFLTENTLKGSIEGVKFDCITFNYSLVENFTVTEEGIRLYGIKDIAAMKLSVIADNGTRLKDFIDVACLSNVMPLSEMLDAYEKKFPNSNVMRPLKGLNYFDDINHKEPIKVINGPYKWENIKRRLQKMVMSPNKVFPSSPLDK